MSQEISKEHCDLLLLVCYIITGLLDSSSILIWGSFVSMQTGNTIYLGLGLAEPSSGTRWIKAADSIGFFCVGSFVFARWHRLLGPARRITLIGSHAVQTLCVAAAAVIVMLDTGSGELRWQIMVPIGFVAFQAGGQAVTSRAVKFNSLTSVVLTSIYCDLFSDAELFAPPTQNAERNRRVAAPICLLIGAIAGGLWGKTSHGITGALWSAVILKSLLLIAWLLWKPAKDDDE